MAFEKFEIKLDKKEIKTTLDDINKSDYYQRIANQVKKLRSGKVDKAFKGNADEWRKILHNSDLKKYDHMVLSILREDYQKYEELIQPIIQFIDFHELDFQEFLKKIIQKKE